MATLETIRTRAGIFISVIIGIALLSFIIDADTLRMATTMFSSKYDAGEIAGESVSIQDYQKHVDEVTRIAQATMGPNATINEQMSEQIREQAWNDFIKERVLYPAFDNAGVQVGDAELTDMMTGNDPSPMVRQLFTNPQTGEFDRSILINAIQNMDIDPNFKTYWLSLEMQLRDQQLLTKYSNLLGKSMIANSLDIKKTVAEMTYDVTFSYVVKPYNVISDSSINIPVSELKKYYNAHKEDFKQERARDIEYVLFPIEPSADDYSTALNEMQRLQNEFEAAPVAELGQFTSFNSENQFDSKYYKQGELPLALDTFAFAEPLGAMLPLYQEGESYRMARISDIKNMPDSVRIQVIALDLTNADKADSIVNALKAGADFGQMAQLYSADPTSAVQGGDIGWRKFDDLMRPIADSCFFLPAGRVFSMTADQGVNIFKVTQRGVEMKKVQVAVVSQSAQVGKATSQSIFAAANNLSTQSQGSYDKFNETLASMGYSKSSARMVKLGDRQIGNLANGREIIRWAYEAKKGDVSEVFEVDNKYFVVAALREVMEEGTQPFEQAATAIDIIVRKQKLAEKFKTEFNEQLKSANNDLATLAGSMGLTTQVQSSPILFTSDYISTSVTPEYALIGAVTTVKNKDLSKPVAGETGVYVFRVDNMNDNPDATNADIEKARFRSMAPNRVYDFYPILIEKADIKDNRGNFY